MPSNHQTRWQALPKPANSVNPFSPDTSADTATKPARSVNLVGWTRFAQSRSDTVTDAAKVGELRTRIFVRHIGRHCRRSSFARHNSRKLTHQTRWQAPPKPTKSVTCSPDPVADTVAKRGKSVNLCWQTRFVQTSLSRHGGRHCERR